MDIIIIDKGILWDLLQAKSVEQVDYVFDQYNVELACMAMNLITNASSNKSIQDTPLFQSAIIIVKLHLLRVTLDYLVDFLKVNSHQSTILTSALLEKADSLSTTFKANQNS